MESIKEKVDQYAKLDNELKEKEAQIASLRTDIVSYAKENAGDEKTVSVKGEESEVKVTFAESLSVNTKSKDFEEVKKAVESGETEVFEKKVSIDIVTDNSEKIINAIIDAGFGGEVLVGEKWSVEKKEFEKIRKTKLADLEKEKLRCKLVGVINISVTPRIQVQ